MVPVLAKVSALQLGRGLLQLPRQQPRQHGGSTGIVLRRPHAQAHEFCQAVGGVVVLHAITGP